jgi:acyl carrier protein
VTTLEEIKNLIHQNFGIALDMLKPDLPLSDYGLDSLSLAELIFTLEEHFKLDIPETQQDISTLTGLATLIDEVKLRQAV